MFAALTLTNSSFCLCKKTVADFKHYLYSSCFIHFNKHSSCYKLIQSYNQLSDEKLKTTTAMLLAEAGCVFMGFMLCFSGRNNSFYSLYNNI